MTRAARTGERNPPARLAAPPPLFKGVKLRGCGTPAPHFPGGKSGDCGRSVPQQREILPSGGKSEAFSASASFAYCKIADDPQSSIRRCLLWPGGKRWSITPRSRTTKSRRSPDVSSPIFWRITRVRKASVNLPSGNRNRKTTRTISKQRHKSGGGIITIPPPGSLCDRFLLPGASRLRSRLALHTVAEVSGLISVKENP